jgi:hypothetical protein
MNNELKSIEYNCCENDFTQLYIDLINNAELKLMYMFETPYPTNYIRRTSQALYDLAVITEQEMYSVYPL